MQGAYQLSSPGVGGRIRDGGLIIGLIEDLRYCNLIIRKLLGTTNLQEWFPF